MKRKIYPSVDCITVATGEDCPCSGEWEIIGIITTTAVFRKGQEMPAYHGKKVFWMLTRVG